MPGWRHAFSLSASAVTDATPPGTVVLIDHNHNTAAGRREDGRGSDDERSRVVKWPIPTSDPADPLTWAPWRKAACMAAVAFYAFVANYVSASMAPALPAWNRASPRDPRPAHELMQLVAFNVLVLGLGNILWVPLANVFGRRPVLVLSTVVLSAASACGMHFDGFLATLLVRIFQGLGSSASETVVPAVVGDLFFVHERGAWMAFYTASLASGSVIGGITGGYIANGLGWTKQFLVATALSGLASLLVSFLVPETTYDRGDHVLPVQQALPRASQIPDGSSSGGNNPRQSSAAAADRRPLSWRATRRISLPPRVSLTPLPSWRLTIPSRLDWPLSQELAPAHGMTWNEASSGDEAVVPPPVPGPVAAAAGLFAPPAGHVAPPPSARRSRATARFSGAMSPSLRYPRPAPQPPLGVACSGANPALLPSAAKVVPHTTIPLSALAARRRAAAAAADQQKQQKPFTFLRSLRFGGYRGRVAHHFAKPWTTLRLPATWVIMLQYGGLVGGVAVISTVGPQILSAPPYRWGPHAGLLFVGALVGILLGALATGFLVDRRLKQLARKTEGGYAEPESRLAVMVPALLVGTLGLLVFGLCAEFPGKMHWLGLEFAYGMVAFALAQVPSVWFNYLIDAYGNLASDCFVIICILRGLIPFAWTFFVAQWVARDGFLIPFGGFTAILGAFALLTVPIIVWGKRMRIATARYVVNNQ